MKEKLKGEGRWPHTRTRTDDSTERKWKIMFFSFDYVIKEMVNVVAEQPWSYGCTLHVFHFLIVQFSYSDSILKSLDAEKVTG